MQLTRHTDYGMRILIYLALLPKGKRANIDTISDVYGISRNNINKIVHQLGQAKIVATIRGKGGGFSLNLSPQDINIGEMVRLMENTLEVVDCEKQRCKILPACKLKSVLNQATQAFLGVLSEYSLADLVDSKDQSLIQLLDLQ